MKNRQVFLPFSSLFYSLFLFSLTMFVILNQNADSVNHFLNIETYKVISSKGEEQLYYPPTVGDKSLSDENFRFLEEECLKQAIKEEQEGAILLYNDRNALPLTEEKNITLLGHASLFPVYKASSAGNYVTEDRSHIITLTDALKNNGFSVNEKMNEAILNGDAKASIQPVIDNLDFSGYSAKGNEEPLSFYEKNKNFIKGYEDCCIITFSRTSSEGYDLLMVDKDDDEKSLISSLALHQNERNLLSFAKNHFKKVIVLLNSPNQMEVEEIKEYADAILAIGQPGLSGFQGVSDILTGKVNPSGRLVDTYAVNSLSAPACVNSGTETPCFENIDAFDKSLSIKEKAKLASFQAENIYVGYKYYETRYFDCVLNRFHAKSNVGSSFLGEWNYEKEISYPFGYGQSYTTFEERIVSSKISKQDIHLDVSIRNTGKKAGKHALMVYASTPYSEYEMENDIEKSAITLVGFEKTKELLPDEEEILSVDINPYYLSSYDEKEQTYILSKGMYYLAIGSSCHSALNQILYKMGASDLKDQDGKEEEKKEGQVLSFPLDFDKETFSLSNGKRIKNLFQDCDLRNYDSAKCVYLSRKDYEKTYPKAKTKVKANDGMLDALRGEFYIGETKDSFSYEPENKNISLISLKDVKRENPLWDEFLSQASLDDLALTTAESFSCPAIESLGSPLVYTGDGMDSIGRTYTFKDGSKMLTMTFACKNILTSTWNKSLYEARGNLMGNESIFTKTFENYCIGPNLHRTPFGGRNFEYMSEDSNLSSMAGTIEARAMEKLMVHAAPKHFAGNDQETGREGVSVFFNEQAFRENDLRAFEGIVKDAKCHGIMQSFERVGLVYASSSVSLNKKLLREEWGFEGNIVTDATYGATFGYKGHIREILSSSTNQFCLDGNAIAGKRIVRFIKEDKDEKLFSYLKESAKIWEYEILNSIAINGISNDSRIVKVTPYWFVLMIVSLVVFFLLGSIFLLLSLVRKRPKTK